MVRRPARLVVALLAAAMPGCGAEPFERPPPVRSGELLARAAEPVALVPLTEGRLRFAELRTGRIRELARDGRVRTLHTLAVATRGQRGLLGLAVDRRDRTYASWVEPGGRLLVGRVLPRPRRVLWRGPRTATLANGGHLALGRDGRLVVAIGDLQRGGGRGRILSLDPRGGPDQRPRVLSAGWNNPFAFGLTPAGELWVADNAPGRRPERIGRGDRADGAARARPLAARSAPSGLAALDDRRLVVCGFASRRLDLFTIDPGRRTATRARRPLATDCTLAVARLPDGRLAYATSRAILALAP